MTKSNPFVKNLKNINKSINSLLERNLNKLKFDNFKTLASNNKIILTVVALFILFVSYLLVPSLYKQENISKKLKIELQNKFNLDFTFNQNIDYNFFPRPHFVSKDSSIYNNQKNIAEVNQIKIYVSLDNLFSIKNINIKEVNLDNANFELNKNNSNFFVKLLNNSFVDSNLKIKNSNIFFKNFENEVLFINKIDNLKYYFDPNELKNVLYAENEIFNIPYTFQVIEYEDEKKLYTKLNIGLAKLQIENIFKYDNNIKSGSATILFNKIKSLANYEIKKNSFEFSYFDELDNQEFLYNGKLNFKPFYSIFEGITEEINISYLFGTNAIIGELLKTEIFNNKNLDIKLNIDAKKIKNKRNFTNLSLELKIQEGLIDIDGSKVEWKDNSIIKLSDTLIYVNEGKLFLDGRSQVNIMNVENIYKFLLTPKNFRKEIKTVDFGFTYVFSERAITLKDIMIDGKYNQKVNKRLNNIYLHDNDLQNKIYFKNIINDVMEAYAG